MKTGALSLLSLLALSVATCDVAHPAVDQAAGLAEGIDQEVRGRRCAGPRGLSCPADQFCDARKEGVCPEGRRFGICASRPEVCTEEFAPVCGCDGKTYGNACTAAAAGVAVRSKGECARRGCRSNADCAARDFCQRQAGSCAGAGVCAPRPEACIQIFDPVCGCDGKTYGNACTAAVAGVSVFSAGECGPFCGGIAGIACPGAGVCADDPSDDCDPARGGADCGGRCRCDLVTLTCAPGLRFDDSPSVCACVR